MFELSIFEMCMYLIAAHFLADFPLQGPFMSEAKNPQNPTHREYWAWVMIGHGSIHAAFVLLITGSWLFAIIEWIVHVIIDLAKCDQAISFSRDQFLHLACKVIYVLVLVHMSEQTLAFISIG